MFRRMGKRRRRPAYRMRPERKYFDGGSRKIANNSRSAKSAQVTQPISNFPSATLADAGYLLTNLFAPPTGSGETQISGTTAWLQDLQLRITAYINNNASSTAPANDLLRVTVFWWNDPDTLPTPEKMFEKIDAEINGMVMNFAERNRTNRSHKIYDKVFALARGAASESPQMLYIEEFIKLKANIHNYSTPGGAGAADNLSAGGDIQLFMMVQCLKSNANTTALAAASDFTTESSVKLTFIARTRFLDV